MARRKILPPIEDEIDQETQDDLKKDAELKVSHEKSYISIGNRMFHVEDIESMYIQANHLIINFDYTDKQVVIFFGHKPHSANNAKIAFESIREMYGAYKIELPIDANLEPNIMDTAYAEKISKAIQSQVHYETQKYKKRHQNKLKKCLAELAYLKEKMDIKT